MGLRLCFFFSLSLRLCFSFEVCVYVFPLGLWYSNVLWGLRIRLYGRGEVCFAQRAREELLRENKFLTTTTTQPDRGLSYGGCTEIQGCLERTVRRGRTGIRGGGDGRSDGGVYIQESPE